jgi:Zn-finger nucleic acid-binding protein
MKCPVDETTLLMSERQGVEIDYCPQCRGVWLDRGELDKLIARGDSDDDDRDDRDDRHDRREVYRQPTDERREYQEYRPPKKKKKFLSEMFDFD